MPYNQKYVCTNPQCGKITPREDLTVRKITFLEMGAGGKTIRSRVTGWLCPRCVVSDLDWNRPPFAASSKELGVQNAR